jgi:DNA polymerase-3 subunit chi
LTSISFYKVGGDHGAAVALVCQLILKAHQRGQQVLCLVERDDQLDALSEQLWAVEPQAFVAHSSDLADPVAISAALEPGDHHDLLINLRGDTPNWFSRFQRVIEVIHSEPAYQQAKRDRFAFYKQRGYPLEFHDLSAKFPAAEQAAQ